MKNKSIRTILYVEDDQVDRRLLQKWGHENENFDIVCVEDLPTARQILDTRAFDAVILDYDLGAHIAFEILDPLPDFPCVILTGMGNEEIAAKALRLGAYDYLVKDPESKYMTLIDVTLENVFARWDAEQTEKRITKQLQDTNKLLKEFASRAAHDLKSPICTINSAIRIIKEETSHLENVSTWTRVIEKCSTQLLALIDDLLTNSMDCNGQSNFKPVDLNNVVETSIANVKALQVSSGAEIIADPLPTIKGRESDLISLFQNLIENALKYRATGHPTKVSIKAETKDNMTRISIRDNGRGIPIEEQNKIFDSFYRGCQSSEGTGLGLYLAKRIVTNHEGNISVRSAPNEGSEFIVDFPSLNG